MARRESDIVDEIKGEGPVLISEIGKMRGIEQMTERDAIRLKEIAEWEKFANEILTIFVHPDNEQGSIEIISPGVNGINQPIIRGKQTRVKRKYVEALARCRTTKYRQKVPNPMMPENIQMVPVTVPSYPFSVIQDPNPRGFEWLQQIMDQA